MNERMFVMYCFNCGNHVPDEADVCLKCGTLLKKSKEPSRVHKIKIRKKNDKILGLISTCFGIIGLVLSFMLYFKDIKSVGMYTLVMERVSYALNYSLFAILFSVIAFILALSSKKNIYSKIGLGLSLFSFFLIISEIIVVIIY